MSNFRPPTILPYVYRVILLASFAFGCTSSLSLQDYIGKEISIGHGPDDNHHDTVSLDDVDNVGLVSQGLFENEEPSTTSTSTACTASDATSTINCPFYSPYMEGATLYSQMTSSPCDDDDPSSSVDIESDTATAQAEGEDVVVASASYPVHSTNHTTNTNTTTNATYCARASLYDDAASVAVMTISIELTLTFHYSSNGTFAIDTLQTKVGNPDGAAVGVQATRAVSVRGRYGRCDAEKEGGTPELGLGDVLAVCAYIEGDDEGRNDDVEIGGVRYVTLRDGGAGGTAAGGTGGGAVLAMPVDQDRKVNFVTVLTPDVNADHGNTSSSKRVTIETLLTPQIFDEGVGDALVVSGVADLKYVDAGDDDGTRRERRRRRHRRLQVAKEGPAREFFNVVVPLRKTNDLPRVAEGLMMDKIQMTNGAADARVGGGGSGGEWGWTLWRGRGKKTFGNGCMSKCLFRVCLSSALWSWLPLLLDAVLF